jgi:hypothetical protein
MWAAADHKHAFTITREHNVEVSPDSFFVVHVSQLDGSYRCRVGRNFKTFDAAVHRCSIYTREARRQVAYHEAGHAVAAHLLGFTGVWLEMDDGCHRAITRHDLLPSILAVADAGSASSARAVLARYQYEELMYFVAGLVAEVRIAGYLSGYDEVDTADRNSVCWEAIRVTRLEAGLPICGHGDCEIPFDAPLDAPNGKGEGGCDDAQHVITQHVTTRRVANKDVAAVIRRAEDEVFDLLKANWRAVLRVVNALCRRDRITSAELDALIAGPKSARKRQRPKRKSRVRNDGLSNDRAQAS